MERRYLLILAFFFMAAGADASVTQDYFAARDTFNNIACNIICVIEYVIVAACALTIVLSAARYMSSDDPNVRGDMRKNFQYALIGLILVFGGIPAMNAMANQTKSPLYCTACSPDSQLFKAIAQTFSCRIICLVQLVAGSILALIIVLSGLRYMASGNDPAARHNAIAQIKNGLIGILIIALAVPVLNYISSGSAAPLNCNCSTIGFILLPTSRKIIQRPKHVSEN